jgi:predicted alpha/beta hydrolase family esterase
MAFRIKQHYKQTEGPIILVAHSLAVILVAHWSLQVFYPKCYWRTTCCSADVDSKKHTPETWNFVSIPVTKLKFPSIVITSNDDPYINAQRAEFLGKMEKLVPKHRK